MLAVTIVYLWSLQTVWTQISVDQDHDQQNVSPDLDPNHTYDTLRVFLKEFLKKSVLKKVSRRQQKHEKLPIMQTVSDLIYGIKYDRSTMLI